MFLERPKGLRVAEEAGDADQKVAKEGLHIGWVLLQVPDILFQPLDFGAPPCAARRAGRRCSACIEKNRDRFERATAGRSFSARLRTWGPQERPEEMFFRTRARRKR